MGHACLMLSTWGLAGLEEGGGSLPGWLTPWFIPLAAIVSAWSIVVEAVYSLSLSSRTKRVALSKTSGDKLVNWERSGELATRLENLTHEQVMGMMEATRELFGEYITKTGTDDRGRTWIASQFRVGLFTPSESSGARGVSNVILYRRDLASVRGIRRPWRTLLRSDEKVLPQKTSQLVEVPSWLEP